MPTDTITHGSPSPARIPVSAPPRLVCSGRRHSTVPTVSDSCAANGCAVGCCSVDGFGWCPQGIRQRCADRPRASSRDATSNELDAAPSAVPIRQRLANHHWMRDPAIHSTTWEWDFVTPAEAWKRTHNNVHHTWTNIVGRDRDVGYTFLRVSEDQPWRPWHLAQPLSTVANAVLFQWGIALFDLELDAVLHGRKSKRKLVGEVGELLAKVTKQLAKDYLLFPLLSGPSALPTLAANVTANLTRNVWAHVIIFCGHFPEDTDMFTEEQIDTETRGEWYVRQLLGSANIDGGPLFHVLSGNLSHQIEHHLFPDLPSNRYAQIAPKVRALCARYDLPYTSGRLTRQYASAWKRIVRLALPTRGRRKEPAAEPSTRQPQPIAA